MTCWKKFCDASVAATRVFMRCSSFGVRCASRTNSGDRAPRRGRGSTDHRHARRTCCLPSGLSPSVQDFHLVNRPLAAVGSRTVTAGSEFHRPRSTCHASMPHVPRAVSRVVCLWVPSPAAATAFVSENPVDLAGAPVLHCGRAAPDPRPLPRTRALVAVALARARLRRPPSPAARAGAHGARHRGARSRPRGAAGRRGTPPGRRDAQPARSGSTCGTEQGIRELPFAWELPVEVDARRLRRAPHRPDQR